MSVYLTWCSSVISSSTVELSSADVSCVLLQGAASGSKLKRPTFHSSRGSLTGENGGTSKPSRTGETTDTFLLCAFYVGKRLIFMLIFSRHKISLVHLRRLACYGLTLKLSWGWIEIENNFSRECFFLQGKKKKVFFPRLKLTDFVSFYLWETEWEKKFWQTKKNIFIRSDWVFKKQTFSVKWALKNKNLLPKLFPSVSHMEKIFFSQM